ncbi:MAG: GNAT family N-acetyltransferase [Christensenellaceae bacterium]|nr:GNAT family N-acetyltransferase [Christensenellaceae bacterium]
MNRIIRLATEADLPRVLAMSDMLIDEGCCNGMTRDTLDDLRANAIHVAEEDGELIGYAYGEAVESSWNIGSCRKGETYYDLDILYVRPEYRSSGVGKELYQAELARARALGVKQFRLTAVNRDWKRLLHLYVEELGFEFWTATLYHDL